MRSRIIGKASIASPMAPAKEFFSYRNGRKRVWELDFVRGLLMVVVTLDHVLLFGLEWELLTFRGEIGEFFREYVFRGYLNSDFRHAVAPIGLWLFAFLSGMSGALTKNCAARAAKGCAFAAVFMGTYALLRLLAPKYIEGYLIFNIIVIVAIGTVTDLLFEVTKTPVIIRFTLAIVTIAVGVTFFYKHFIDGGTYVENGFLSLLVYNGHGYNLSPNNFEPLFPHLGWFMLGAVIGRYVYKEKRSVTGVDTPPGAVVPIAWVGKHSLFFYIFGAVAILLPLIEIDRLLCLFI